jgi:hypothetical protein
MKYYYILKKTIIYNILNFSLFILKKKLNEKLLTKISLKNNY